LEQRSDEVEGFRGEGLVLVDHSSSVVGDVLLEVDGFHCDLGEDGFVEGIVVLGVCLLEVLDDGREGGADADFGLCLRGQQEQVEQVVVSNIQQELVFFCLTIDICFAVQN